MEEIYVFNWPVNVNIRIVMAVINLEIETEIDCENLIPGFRLLPAGHFVENDLRHEELLLSTIGELESNDLKKYTCLMYDGDLEYLKYLYPSYDLLGLTAKINGTIHAVFDFLWLIKDNSIYFRNLYFDFTQIGLGIIKNERPNMLSNSTGKYSTIKVSKEDFVCAENLYINCLDIDSEKSIDDTKPEPTTIDEGVAILNPSHWKPYTIHSIKRYLLFLHMARKESFLPIKISFYVMMLECLFSTDGNSEVTHKVAERAALFIGIDSADRKDIFTNIKDSYSIRSNFLHGQTLAKKQNPDAWIIHSKFMDTVLRKILTKILSSKKFRDIFSSNDKEKVNNLFQELQFRDSVSNTESENLI